jgi:hypothetical protein
MEFQDYVLNCMQQELNCKDNRINELEAELTKFRALDLGKLSYYERNKTRLKRESADKRWCCRICNVEVSNNRRAGHLETKSHKLKAAMAEGVKPDPKLLVWGGGSREYVHCQVCDMQVNARTVAQHEKTEVHLERLAAKTMS